MSDQRMRALLEKESAPADAEMIDKLVKIAYQWRNAADIQKAVDKAVAAAYARGWHQGWKDAPCD